MKDSSLKRGQIKIETLAATLLLIVLAAQTMLLIASTGNSYKKIMSAGNTSKEIRTTLSFISTKIRQADNPGQIRVVKTPWSEDALVISEKINNETYENWIFYFEGTVREILIPKGGEIVPSSCDIISKTDYLHILQAGSKITVIVKKISNNIYTGNQIFFESLDITLRT